MALNRVLDTKRVLELLENDSDLSEFEKDFKDSEFSLFMPRALINEIVDHTNQKIHRDESFVPFCVRNKHF